METSRPKKGALRIQRSTPATDRDRSSAFNPRRQPLVCRSCTAVLKNDSWVWGSAPDESEFTECPACRRIADGRPSATVFVPTEMIKRRRQEVFALIRNIETTEMQRNPLERIIKICDNHKSIIVETTGEHIANRIAYAIKTITRATITTRHESGMLTLVVA